MGMDHPQWEMYSSSKHGVRHSLRQSGILPEQAAAPTRQTCHMPEGNHEVRTAWGFLAVRLPLPEDEQWAADRVTILQALGVLDPQGNPTARLEVVKGADVARLTQEDWQAERDRMIQVCEQCHSANLVQAELRKGDETIREADRLLAEAIRIIAALYRDGVLRKPDHYAYNYPDLLAFHDAPTVIEKLFKIHLEHRVRAFQGAFHVAAQAPSGLPVRFPDVTRSHPCAGTPSGSAWLFESETWRWSATTPTGKRRHAGPSGCGGLGARPAAAQPRPAPCPRVR